MSVKKEIEKKWIVSKLPSEKTDEKLKIFQGYAGEIPDEVRLREINTGFSSKYLVTRKEGTGFSRIEHESGISKEAFLILKPAFLKKSLEKTRYIYKINGLNWELDRYHGKLEGLYTLEVELPEESYIFEIPDFLKKIIIKDVTGKVEFLNSSLVMKNFSDISETLDI